MLWHSFENQFFCIQNFLSKLFETLYYFPKLANKSIKTEEVSRLSIWIFKSIGQLWPLLFLMKSFSSPSKIQKWIAIFLFMQANSVYDTARTCSLYRFVLYAIKSYFITSNKWVTCRKEFIKLLWYGPRFIDLILTK